MVCRKLQLIKGRLDLVKEFCSFKHGVNGADRYGALLIVAHDTVQFPLAMYVGNLIERNAGLAGRRIDANRGQIGHGIPFSLDTAANNGDLHIALVKIGYSHTINKAAQRVGHIL